MAEYVYVLIERLVKSNGGIADSHHSVYWNLDDAVKELRRMAEYHGMNVNNAGTYACTKGYDSDGYAKRTHTIEINRTDIR